MLFTLCSPYTIARTSAIMFLYIFAVERRYGEVLGIYSIEAAYIDSYFREGNTLGKRLHAAGFAEKMTYPLLVELVFGDRFFARSKGKCIFVHECEDKALFVAVRAIALDEVCEICFDLVPYCSAVASAGVFHVRIVPNIAFSVRLVHTLGVL